MFRFALPKTTLQAKLEKCQAAPPGFEPGSSAYRADALVAALWCSFYPQRRKHDISPTCLHLLTIHTQVGPRPQTIVGSATFLVQLSPTCLGR